MAGIRLGVQLLAHSSSLVRNPLPKEAMDTETSIPNGFHHDLAPDGVYPAMTVTSHAVRSYRTVSPLLNKFSGLFSVALSFRLP